MKQKHVPESKYGLEELETPDDYRRLFLSLDIPNEKWRSSYWLHSIAKLSKNRDGIGKDLRDLVEGITDTFGTFTLFLDWMDGVPINGITSDNEAQALLEAECQRLGVSMQEMLSGERTPHLLDTSAVLREVLSYFKDKQ